MDDMRNLINKSKCIILKGLRNLNKILYSTISINRISFSFNSQVIGSSNILILKDLIINHIHSYFSENCTHKSSYFENSLLNNKGFIFSLCFLIFIPIIFIFFIIFLINFLLIVFKPLFGINNNFQHLLNGCNNQLRNISIK